MRILLLIPTLTGAGAERQLGYLAAELQRRGNEVLVGYVVGGRGGAPPLPLHRFPHRRAWSPLLIADIARLIRSWQPDIVQTCLPRMDVAGGLAAILTRVPFVIREANAGTSYSGVRAVLRKLVGRRAAEVVAISHEAASQWPHAVVIRNGVPFDAIAATPPAPRPPHNIVGISVSRLVPEKNVDILLRACAAVPGVFLIVCGSGSLHGRLEALARELGIADRVELAGFVQDVWARERAADFAALVSDFEGNPNAVAECFAAGTPMILSDIPALREMASEDEALFVPPRDIEATAAAIRRLLDDPAAARERALRARGRARGWTVEAMADAYERTFQNLLAPRRQSSYPATGP